eukprot:COSAG02_NODE_4813_length_4949_cov_2.146598_6_plen_62_part_00
MTAVDLVKGFVGQTAQATSQKLEEAASCVTASPSIPWEDQVVKVGIETGVPHLIRNTATGV